MPEEKIDQSNGTVVNTNLDTTDGTIKTNDEITNERSISEVDNSNRRQHPRVPYYAEIRVIGRSETYFHRAENVSFGGVCLRTSCPLPLGTEVTVVFPASIKVESFTIDANVVWVDPNFCSTSAIGYSQPNGAMGLCFHRMGEYEQQQLQLLIHSFQTDPETSFLPHKEKDYISQQFEDNEESSLINPSEDIELTPLSDADAFSALYGSNTDVIDSINTITQLIENIQNDDDANDVSQEMYYEDIDEE